MTKWREWTDEQRAASRARAAALFMNIHPCPDCGLDWPDGLVHNGCPGPATKIVCKRCTLRLDKNDAYWLIQSNNTEGDQPEPWDPQKLYRVHARCLQAGDSLVGSALEDEFWTVRDAVGQ